MSQEHHSGQAVRVTTRPMGDAPEPGDAPFAVERIAALTHDLGNLLDGSMRYLGLARRSLGAVLAAREAEGVHRQLDVVYASLERMADLVHAAMRSSASVVGSPTMTPMKPISLEEAAEHAAEVLRPEAGERGIEITTAISPDAAGLPAGPLYSVILNAIRNAVESIARAQVREMGVRSGHVEIAVNTKPVGPAEDASVDLVLLEVRDDGAGVPGEGDTARAFDLGYSTKPGGMGIGLALARDVVREFGGMIELVRRTDRGSPDRPGAILKVAYPIARKKPEA